MAVSATTFRFEESIRLELERIQQDLGTTTLQKTVETLISEYELNKRRIREANAYASKVNNDNTVMRERLTAIKGVFNIVLEYPIP
jgi:molybdenum-dependent DNA-binding transcriptional regulator ModE